MTELPSLARNALPLANRRRDFSASLLAWAKTLAALFKLRVVFLLLAAALAGAALAAGGLPDFGSAVLLTVTGALSAGGASAVNQYLERERDQLMARTRRRPLPTGQICQPAWALAAGAGMALAAVLLALVYNPAMAFFTAIGALIYVGVYTLWLKPRSVLNIVIGGAAGSCAVLSGGAAAGAWNAPGVLALALLLFLWTPVHFWSLAMAYRQDYAAAGFPMLPARVTPRQAAAWVGLHALASGLAALAMAALPGMGLWYALPVGLATARLGALSLRLLRTPEKANALALFIYSNLYLGIVLVVLMLRSVWR